ncbi:YveK family protein [Massilibacterium senegalense]|uniref:YveK family protein n=1 Tax=Massilibacterium senegalense TaxID=1632858 RepID=UPI000782B615|nr:Wzz/FepE/Etk N-terminal domain-containing protein [Massilibacterium senegalense]
MEETISLKEIFETLKERFQLIVFITLFAVLVTGVVTYFFITPVYQASTQILINQSQDSNQPTLDVNQVRTNVELINTYSVIIKSPTILDKVNKELGLNMTSDELGAQLEVTSEQNSQVVNVVVNDTDPERAALIANTVAETFKNEISNIMNVNNVNILSKAKAGEDPSPVKPKPLLNMAIGLVVGLMLAIGLAFLLEYLDNTIKTEDDIMKNLEAPVLGVIAKMDN